MTEQNIDWCQSASTYLVQTPGLRGTRWCPAWAWRCGWCTWAPPPPPPSPPARSRTWDRPALPWLEALQYNIVTLALTRQTEILTENIELCTGSNWLISSIGTNLALIHSFIRETRVINLKIEHPALVWPQDCVPSEARQFPIISCNIVVGEETGGREGEVWSYQVWDHLWSTGPGRRGLQ